MLRFVGNEESSESVVAVELAVEVALTVTESLLPAVVSSLEVVLASMVCVSSVDDEVARQEASEHSDIGVAVVTITVVVASLDAVTPVPVVDAPLDVCVSKSQSRSVQIGNVDAVVVVEVPELVMVSAGSDIVVLVTLSADAEDVTKFSVIVVEIVSSDVLVRATLVVTVLDPTMVSSDAELVVVPCIVL